MLEVLNLEQALGFLGGEKDLLAELLKAFVNSRPFAEETLIQLEKENKLEAAKYIHYYKGAARQIGAERLAQTGQALEDELRGRTETDLDLLTQSFLTTYSEALAAVKDALEIL